MLLVPILDPLTKSHSPQALHCAAQASCVGCATNLSHALEPCPLDGCPMFADLRVHGLNKMGDPDFLPRGTHQRPRVRLSVGKPHEVRQRHQTPQEIRGKPLLFLFL